MMKKYLVLIIILAALFSGCTGKESISGKYVYTDNNKSYFILHEDGTFNEWFINGNTASGTYRYEGNTLTLTYQPFGNVNEFTKDGTAFVYDGWKYVKE